MLDTPSSPMLVGRDHELAVLREHATQVTKGEGGALLVRGEAGVGKTRLVRELVLQARHDGTTVLQGGCVSIGGEPLRLAALTELIRAWRRKPQGLAAPSLAGLSTEEMLEQLLTLVDGVVAPESRLIVVEDLHWADRGTCLILNVLARHVVGRPVGLVMTCRDGELPRDHHVRQFLVELTRAQLATPVVLSPLAAADVARLVDTLVGGADAAAVATVFRRSEGNPLIVEELCAGGRDGIAGSLDGALRDIMLARFWRLSTPSREVVQTVAVAGSPVDQSQLAAVLGFDGALLSKPLREALDLQVLALTHDAVGVRHVLMAEAVYGELLPDERIRLHSRWASVLSDARVGGEPLGASALDAPDLAPRLAHHWFEAGEEELAFDASLVAARDAAAELAFDAAYRHYRRAASLWDRVDDPERRAGLSRADLSLASAETANWAGDPAGAVAAVDAALALPAEADDPGTESLLLERRAWYLLRQGENEAARAGYERALVALPATADAATRARVLAGSVRAWERAGDFDHALELARNAVDIAERAGATAEVGPARYMYGRILLTIGAVDAAIEELEQSALAAEATLNPVLLAIALLERGDGLARRQRLAEGVTAALDAGARLRGRGHPDHALLATAAASALAHRLGQTSESRELASTILRDAGTPVTLAVGHLVAGMCDVERAMPTAAREHLETARVLAAPLIDGRVAAALAMARVELALADRDVDSAASAIDEGIAKVAHSGDDEALAHLCLHGLRVQADRDALAVGRRTERSRRRRDETLTAFERNLAEVLDAPPTGADRPDLNAIRSTWKAERARLDGDSDPVAWADAAQCWSAVQWPRWSLYAELRRAEALAHASAPASSLADALQRLYDEAGALGSARVLGEVVQLARRTGVSLPEMPPQPSVRTPAPASRETAALTPREREVLELVAAGATNRQIAVRLFISEKTASVHVSRILTKLGVTNRQEAGAVARRARHARPR